MAGSIDRQSGMGYSEPSPAISESFTGGMIAPAANAILDFIPTRTTTTTDKSAQTQYSKNALDDMIYQMLSGNSGVAALGAAENVSGGYKSGTKQLQLADLIASTAAEVAKAKAPQTSSETTTSKKKKSVICTVLYEQGLLDKELYFRGQQQFIGLPTNLILGYYTWAYWVANRIPSNKVITQIARFIAVRRYTYVLFGQFSVTGWISVHVGEPLCKVIHELTRNSRSPA